MEGMWESMVEEKSRDSRKRRTKKGGGEGERATFLAQEEPLMAEAKLWRITRNTRANSPVRFPDQISDLAGPDIPIRSLLSSLGRRMLGSFFGVPPSKGLAALKSPAWIYLTTSQKESSAQAYDRKLEACVFRKPAGTRFRAGRARCTRTCEFVAKLPSHVALVHHRPFASSGAIKPHQK